MVQLIMHKVSLLSLILLIGLAGLGLYAEDQSNKNTYPVSHFHLVYGKAYPDLSSLEEITKLKIELGFQDGVYISPSEGGADSTIVLGDSPSLSHFTPEALRLILARVLEFWNQKDYYGVYAMFDPAQIDPRTGADKRPINDASLKLVVWFSEVSELRTIAKGSAIDPDKAINNSRYKRLAQASPLSPSAGAAQKNLIRSSVLENYLNRLNRHPGRQVDASISASGELGGVVLDLLVNEQKPYVIYGQVSNTGTESTGEWRERIGFIHNQLTGHDDILSLDYVTAEFDSANSVLGSYQIPLIAPNYLKFRVYASYSEYDADEVGVNNIDFEGENTQLGAEFIASPFFIGKHYVDFVGGIRWNEIEVDNITISQVGEAETLIPYLGASVGNRSYLGSSHLGIVFEQNVSSISETERNNLGRLETADDWLVARLDSSFNTYLEPLLWPKFWRDRSTWYSSTLAYEIGLRLKAQYVFDDKRLIPQEQLISGGFFSVRGYPESVANGDNGFVASAEYRYHLPRIFKPNSVVAQEGGTPSKAFGKYNLRPPQVYARPDWDLVFRTFVDVAHLESNNEQTGEDDLDLLSVGLGVELQLLSNLNLRTDWGYVLSELERNGITVDDADKGDSRFHFMGTVSW